MDPNSNPPSRSRPAEEWLDAAVELMGRAGKRGMLRVQGISMIPTFRPGWRIEVDFSRDRARLGEILLFRQQGELVVHRFLGRVRSRAAGPCLRTRGDGIPNLDPPLQDDRVVGRAVAVERAGRWRSLRGSLPRLYAVLVALHDHFWAAAFVLARAVDRHLDGAGMPAPCRRVVRGVDRFGLRLTDAVMFAALHRRIDPPALAGETDGE